MVPEGWIEGRVEDLLEGIESGVSVNGEERYNNGNDKAVLKVSSVSYGIFDPFAAKIIEKKDLNRAKTNPKSGQIIISRSNTDELVGASAFISQDYPNLFLPDKLWQTISKPDSDMKWLSYLLASRHVRYTLSNLATGTSGSMKNITQGELLKLKILIPPLAEQKKIAQILSTWDKAIATTEKLLENSQKQKQALMQQLLTGKKRFQGFSGDWSQVSLSDIANIEKGKAISSVDINFGDYPVIAGGKSSPYKHNSFTHENVITVSASGAYAGYVAYHPYKIWASDCSVVSAKQNSSIKYVFFYLEYQQNHIYSLQSGGAQPHIYPKDLGVLKLKVPSLAEQEKIASVLNIADKEIQTIQTKLDLLKEEKRALMQQLLTGKRRVRI